MGILILLPPAALILLFLALLGSVRSKETSPDPWQGKFLLAIALWGGYLVLLTEGLGLVRSLTRWPIAAGWSFGLVIILNFGLWHGRLKRGYRAAVGALGSMGKLERLLLVGMGGLALLLFAVAVAAPTNNVDAMDYHMPRVLEWAQNKTLTPFPTTHPYQNVRPYWAEAVILHLRVLWGNDQPAGLVQWMIMVSAVVAVSGIAQLLGGDRKAQWLTAIVAFSIPMGLLQSTTTQNDYVSAFWVVCLGYFVLLSRERRLYRLEVLALGLALSLGMLTKGTFFPYAAALVAWYAVGRVGDGQWKRIFLEGLLFLVVVVASNGLFWVRNIQATGGPYGTGNPLQLLNKLLPGNSFLPADGALGATDEAATPSPDRAAAGTGGVYIVTTGVQSDLAVTSALEPSEDPHVVQVLRLLAMNYVSPFSAFNAAYFEALRAMPELFPEPYVRKLGSAAWNHEDTAGSPVHLTLVFISMLIVGLQGIRGRFKHGLAFALVLLGAFVLVSVIGSGDDIYVIRYQLGFVLLGAPLIALIMPRRKALWFTLSVLFLLYSLPYILFSNMRPVLGHTPWPTRVPSVFTADKEDLLFAINPGSRGRYDQITSTVLSSGCRNVGLAFSGRNLEYQIWYLLRAPQSGIEIQHLLSLPDFARYRDPDFEPCAVICTNCDELPAFREAIEDREAQPPYLILVGPD